MIILQYLIFLVDQTSHVGPCFWPDYPKLLKHVLVQGLFRLCFPNFFNIIPRFGSVRSEGIFHVVLVSSVCAVVKSSNIIEEDRLATGELIIIDECRWI